MLTFRKGAATAIPGGARAMADHLMEETLSPEAVAMRPGQGLVLAATASDHYVVDGAVEGLARGTVGLGRLVRRTESGLVRSYAGYMLAGAVLALIAVLASRF